jgi:tetratricopeptide (TPR) repeat protein
MRSACQSIKLAGRAHEFRASTTAKPGPRAHATWPAVLALLGASLTGCPRPTAPRYVPNHTASDEHLRSPAEQVALADRLVEQQPHNLDALSRADRALGQAQKTNFDAFAVSWRRARVCFLLARTLKNREQRVETAQRGAAAARRAIALDQSRVEGHYYRALNLAQIAEADSRLSLVKQMVRVAKRSAEIDPAYDGAGALVYLGKLYLTAPAWPVSVGNVEEAITALERALALAPRPLTRIFLGQAYFEDDREAEARAQLERALAEAGPGDLEPRWRTEAQSTLSKME